MDSAIGGMTLGRMIVRLQHKIENRRSVVSKSASSGSDGEGDMSFPLRALDFVADRRSSRDLSELVERFLDLVAPLGISNVAMTDILRAEPDLGASVRFTTFEEEWVTAYIRDRWDRHDPIWHAAFRNHSIARWSTILEEFGPDRNWAMARYHDAGILDGLTIPINVPRTLRSAIFLGASRRLQMGPADEAALTLAAGVFGSRAGQLVPERTPDNPLTARERDILIWTAMGKSARQVALVLDISEKTVARHLLNIRNKLRAVNTVQAVARAIREEMITF